ncbi:MAG TPA: MlaD family protein [Sulfurovum sp.]|uniref:PqiB family protein n=1 Tax=Sulfurovum sp. TaxID=1969726 RepID=UPI002F943F31
MSTEIPQIDESSKFNLITSIWIVPFIALIIAGWLAYQYFSELGPEIKIVFPENQGLIAGQSQIKYRNVPIGTVKKIVLQKDGEGVTVIARMEKSATRYLNSNARFWIVKPEVGISGVSGLETLISGTYIDMYSEKGGESKKTFPGLTQPYRYTEEGEYFQLSAPSSYGVKQGTPVYFKNIEAGQVEHVNISIDGQSVEFVVFVNKLYVPYVHRSSKFWVKSAVEVSFVHGRLDVSVAPVTHLVQGGIEFSSTGENVSDRVPDKFVFHLHKNATLAEGQVIGKGGDFITTFEILTEDSIAKLKKDALVQYEGYEVGRVKEIALSYNKDTHKILGQVLVDIDLSSFALKEDDMTRCSNKFTQALEEGLSAKISSTDPLTGTLFVDLVFDRNTTGRSIQQGEKYVRIPSLPNDARGLVEGVEALLASLNEVVDDNAEPLQKIVSELQQTVHHLNAMTGTSAFKTMPDELNRTMKELNGTLKTAQKVLKGYDSDSLLTHQVSQTLKEVTETSQEMQEFLKLMNRKPNSLIFGDK